MLNDNNNTSRWLRGLITSILMIFEIEKQHWIEQTNEGLDASIIGSFDGFDECCENVNNNDRFTIFVSFYFLFCSNAYKSQWLTVLLFE